MPGYESANFFRVVRSASESRIKPIEQEKRSAKQNVYLVPFKMLSISGFKFPFSSLPRVREALRMQTSYITGEVIQIFPVPVLKGAKEISGFACFLPDTELSEIERTVGTQASMMPAPFSLVSAVNGNGATIWADEDNICSAVWNAGVPELYRWRARKEKSLEIESEWLHKYCASKELHFDKPFISDMDKEDDLKAFPSILKNSLAEFSWLREINLSRSAINSAMALEKIVRALSRTALWVTAIGIVFAAGSWLSYAGAQKSLSNVRASNEMLYREVFDKEGRIVDPVSQARGKINALRGSGTTGKTLINVLADLGLTWKAESVDITLDSMRYNADGADLTGSAADVATIQSLRSSLNELGGTVQLGEMQQIPSGGFRFNLSFRW